MVALSGYVNFNLKPDHIMLNKVVHLLCISSPHEDKILHIWLIINGVSTVYPEPQSQARARGRYATQSK